MSYEILQIAERGAFIVRSKDLPGNTIEIPSLRDLLLLRARLDRYISDLAPDGIIPTTSTQPMTNTQVKSNARPNNDLITVAQAFEIAEAEGYTIPRTTLNSAVYRGTIPGTTKRGTRWSLPRAAFEKWLQQWIATQ